MISQIIIELGLLSLLFMWKNKKKYDTIAGGLFTILFAVLFYRFITAWSLHQESEFVLLWDSSKSGDIRLNINSTLQNYQMIFPFFVITLLSMLNNLFFRYENHKKTIILCMALNFMCLIMLIASDNFIQMITFVFIIDIISQLLIKDVNASRGYAIYNLIADMGLFLVFALLRGNDISLNLGNFSLKAINHQNFAAILILLSLVIKLGFFIFHTYLLDLTSTKFHRLILVFYLSSPIVAIILLTKLSIFLHHFVYFDILMNILIYLSLLWGGVGLILITELKSKAVYMNMMLLSILTKLALPVDFTWNNQFSVLLILAFSLNVCLYYLHYYLTRENSFSNKFKSANVKPIYFLIAVWTLVLAAFSMDLFSFYTDDNKYSLLGFISLFLFGSAHTFSQSVQLVKQQMYTENYDKRPFLILGIIMFLSCVVLVRNYTLYWPFALFTILTFLMFLFLFPMRFVFKDVGSYDKLQQLDFFPKLYNVILFNPIRATGKAITLFVDFMFFEKTLRGLVNTISGFIIRTFRQLSRNGLVRYVTWILLSILVMFWFLLEGQF